MRTRTKQRAAAALTNAPEPAIYTSDDVLAFIREEREQALSLLETEVQELRALEGSTPPAGVYQPCIGALRRVADKIRARGQG